jgi:hypothetical protein
MVFATKRAIAMRTTQAMGTAMRVASNKEGAMATTWAMATATRVAGNEESIGQQE